MSDVLTLGEALPQEIARVRDEVLSVYLEIGPAGAFGAAMIRAQLDRASHAMVSGDLAEMIAVYQELKEVQL